MRDSFLKVEVNKPKMLVKIINKLAYPSSVPTPTPDKTRGYSAMTTMCVRAGHPRFWRMIRVVHKKVAARGLGASPAWGFGLKLIC
jgi:hypothetical protein